VMVEVQAAAMVLVATAAAARVAVQSSGRSSVGSAAVMMAAVSGAVMVVAGGAVATAAAGMEVVRVAAEVQRRVRLPRRRVRADRGRVVLHKEGVTPRARQHDVHRRSYEGDARTSYPQQHIPPDACQFHSVGEQSGSGGDVDRLADEAPRLRRVHCRKARAERVQGGELEQRGQLARRGHARMQTPTLPPYDY